MLRAVLAVALLPILSSASTVYLHPPPASTATSPQVLAQHLRLEAFFPAAAPHVGEVVLGGFVGQGARDGLIVELDAGDPDDVIPASFKPSFKLPTSPSLLDEYTRAAQRTYGATFSSDGDTPATTALPRILDVFALAAASSTVKSTALETFLSRLTALVAFVEDDAASVSDRFGAFDVTGLPAVAQEWGTDSEVYHTATSALKAVLSSALTKPHTSLAVLLSSPTAPLAPRAPQSPPQQSPLPIPPPSTAPIFSTSTCFASDDVCRNATAACSSRGSCVPATRAGRTCFVCECRRAPLEDGGKKFLWAGAMCHKKDISQEFSLIVGTVLFLLLVVVGSVSLLYTVGDQELPGTLTGGAPGAHHKHD